MAGEATLIPWGWQHNGAFKRKQNTEAVLPQLPKAEAPAQGHFRLELPKSEGDATLWNSRAGLQSKDQSFGSYFEKLSLFIS